MLDADRIYLLEREKLAALVVALHAEVTKLASYVAQLSVPASDTTTPPTS